MQLRDVVEQTIVLCYEEDVTPLISMLEVEGLRPIEQRAIYSDAELNYSRTYRCFMNHRNAWLKASESSGWTLICESDFVPCIGIGGFSPCWPTDDDHAFAFLYQGSPRALALINGLIRVHCGALVAYVVNAQVAKHLLEIYRQEMDSFNPTHYATMETRLQWRAMGRGLRAFMPEYHYGEHGGLANPEHRAAGIMTRNEHRADNLVGPLAFLPAYARGSLLKFWAIRVLGRAYGVARLVTGRWWFDTDVYNLSQAEKWRLFLVGVRRLALPYASSRSSRRRQTNSSRRVWWWSGSASMRSR